MKTKIKLFLKGVVMGAADIVPGVSGGTVAFISGIYNELIYSLQMLGPTAFIKWHKEGWHAFWNYINGNFLAILFSGVLFGIFILSHLMNFLLETYPIPVWSFFIGVILASVFSLIQKYSISNFKLLLSFVIGIISGWYVTNTTFTPSFLLDASPYIFLPAGMLAVCAMILPGISGSFILLILGLYQPVLYAVKSLQIDVLLLLAIGCIIGLLCFSRFLNWLLTHFKKATIAYLTGLMLGSVYILWPWKMTIPSENLNGSSKIIMSQQINISPFQFEQINGDSYLTSALFAIVLGILLIAFTHKITR